MLDFKNYTEIVMGEVNKAIAGKTFLNKTHTNLKVKVLPLPFTTI